MGNDIRALEPKKLWENFYQLTQIPRPSNHEDKIQEFIVDFGRKLGLETIKDEVGNVIIRKPATSGMENKKGVIFQGHLDMVPQKNSDKVHDFENDPIEAFVDGQWVTANGTTLGADNGIGAAIAMSILESNEIEHGPIEALFTATEETGMDGAMGLKPEVLKGDVLLNTDTEDEGVFSVGCAGGIDVFAKYQTKMSAKLPKNPMALKLEVTGLKGGHSGVDIHLGRANANKIFFRIIKRLNDVAKVRLADIQGGSLRNAIPREAFGLFVFKSDKKDILVDEFESIVAEIKAELMHVEEDLKVELKEALLPDFIFKKDFQRKLTTAVLVAPNDVVRMSDTMFGTVETSTNMAIVKLNDFTVEISCLVRSFSETSKLALANRLKDLFEITGARVVLEGDYPGWIPNIDSEILEVMKQVYKSKFGEEPKLLAMHAGLECGILGSIYPNWDMISYGPTIKYPHSPDEKVNIETVRKVWDFTIEVLKAIPNK